MVIFGRSCGCELLTVLKCVLRKKNICSLLKKIRGNIGHVIHSYRCESLNTNTTWTVMCFCFISQRIYCIINDSRCPLVNSPHFICLKHTAVGLLSNQKANQLSKGCYLTKYLSNSVIVFTTNLFFILSNMMKCGPPVARNGPKVNYCDISNIQLRTKRTQPVVA